MRVLSLLFSVFVLFWGASANGASNDDNMVLGGILAEQLLDEYPSFKLRYDEVEISLEQAEKARAMGNIEVLAVFGSWCHDSQREIPAMIKLAESAANIDLTLVGVGFDKSLSEPLYDITEVARTPTVFVFRNGELIGKFVERSEGGVVSDILRF